ncbi:uncharacterized protein BDZ83DRAFT_602329, partial [Colletotrichum acutatum]
MPTLKDSRHGHGGHGPGVAMDGEMQSQHGAAKAQSNHSLVTQFYTFVSHFKSPVSQHPVQMSRTI